MQKHSPLPGMLAGLLLTTSALVAQATEQAVSDSSGSRVLRNGPFHRTLLDGYFPFHVRLEVQYPPATLRYLGVSPEPQPGFAVDSGDGLLTIDSWFAGALNIEISFTPLKQDTTSAR